MEWPTGDIYSITTLLPHSLKDSEIPQIKSVEFTAIERKVKDKRIYLNGVHKFKIHSSQQGGRASTG